MCCQCSVENVDRWRSVQVSGVFSDIKWDVVVLTGPLMCSFGLKVQIIIHTHETGI